jgi:hypothetical protein
MREREREAAEVNALWTFLPAAKVTREHLRGGAGRRRGEEGREYVLYSDMETSGLWGNGKNHWMAVRSVFITRRVLVGRVSLSVRVSASTESVRRGLRK